MDYELIILLSYTVVSVGMIITVLLDNRQPVKTLAWIMVLVFLPIVGIALYFFFGQNTRKERVISRKQLDKLTKRSLTEYGRQKNLQIPYEHNKLISLFSTQNLAMPYKDNETEIFTDGYQMFLALLQSIGKARHHIHLETYIFDDDELGRLIADALVDKARQGVEVRVVYDDVGCWRVHDAFFRRISRGGVDIRAFLPVHFPLFTSKVNYRNHRKICIIDGCEGFVGGMNIANRYVKGEKDRPWRDTHVRLRGPAVYGLQQVFLTDWYFITRKLLSSHEYYPAIPFRIHNDGLTQIVTSSPVNAWPDIMLGYVRILSKAKKYVYIESPYFLPTEPVLFAMQSTALSGVDVRLMIPRRTDSFFINWASRTYLGNVISAGVKVFLYEKGFNHSKLLVSDDSLATIGSTNVDFRSFENNMEVNAFFYDTEMAHRVKQVFEEDLKHCFLLNDHATHRRHFFVRLWESLVRLLSPLL